MDINKWTERKMEKGILYKIGYMIGRIIGVLLGYVAIAILFVIGIKIIATLIFDLILFL